MENYKMVRKIGAGAFGQAFLVRDKKSTLNVIKEVKTHAMSAKERDDARKEVAVLSQLKHPNIVSYIDSFENNGCLYIVMDYCDGGDLYSKINAQNKRLFKEDVILEWFTQCALAIKHCHDRKILHRDIKCQNIFLTSKEVIKLGDFGIAKVLNCTSQMANTMIGTPYYLSPEIVQGQAYDNKSDVWSLGCVIYELTTLKHAFDAGNMRGLMVKICSGKYPPISPNYSIELRNMIDAMFQKNPIKRPSVNALLRKPLLQHRARKFLSDAVYEAEFSHTVLHGEVVMQRQSQPPQVAPQPVSRPQSAAVGGRRAAPVHQIPRNRPTSASGIRINRASQLRQQEINRRRQFGWVLPAPQPPSDDAGKKDPVAAPPPPKKPSVAASPYAQPVRQQPPDPYSRYNEYLKQMEARRKLQANMANENAKFVANVEEDQNKLCAELQVAAQRAESSRLAVARAASNHQSRLADEFLNRRREAAENRARGKEGGAVFGVLGTRKPICTDKEAYEKKLQELRMRNLARNRPSPVVKGSIPVAPAERMRRAEFVLKQQQRSVVDESVPPIGLTDALKIIHPTSELHDPSPKSRAVDENNRPSYPIKVDTNASDLTKALAAITPRFDSPTSAESTPCSEQAMSVDVEDANVLRIRKQQILADLNAKITDSTLSPGEAPPSPVVAIKTTWQKPSETFIANLSSLPVDHIADGDDAMMEAGETFVVRRGDPNPFMVDECRFNSASKTLTASTLTAMLSDGQFDLKDTLSLRTYSLPDLTKLETPPDLSPRQISVQLRSASNDELIVDSAKNLNTILELDEANASTTLCNKKVTRFASHVQLFLNAPANVAEEPKACPGPLT